MQDSDNTVNRRRKRSPQRYHQIIVTNVSCSQVQDTAVREGCNCRKTVPGCGLSFIFIFEAVLCHSTIVVQDCQYKALVETQVMALKLLEEMTGINHSFHCEYARKMQ
jgi:hypothetical protein